MRVLVAPDAFGPVGSVAVAAALASGWSRQAPDDQVATIPLGDGGPGILDAIGATSGGTTEVVGSTDALGRPTPAELLRLDRPHGARTAVVDTSQVLGLSLLGAGELDPMLATSYGVGALLLAARDTGATRVVVGLGPAASHDGGAGALSALGVGVQDRLGGGAGSLADLGPQDLRGLSEARAAYREVDLVLAYAEDVPLVGLDGLSAQHAARAGASAQTGADLERLLAGLAHAADLAAVMPVELTNGRRLRPERMPGAGAGGGLGYALSLLGGRLVPGPRAVADEVGLDAALTGADLVLTGEPVFDGGSLHGSVVSEVARRAQDTATPVVLLAQRVRVGRREAMAAGFAGCYDLAGPRPPGSASDGDAEALHDLSALADRAARLAATWSPRR